MKRLILSALSMICLYSAVGSASQQATEDYEKYLTDTPFYHPLFEKVFPGVIIADQEDRNTRPPRHRLVALYQGKRWQMPMEFNRLYREVAAKSKASVLERLETYARMYYWYHDANLQILKNEMKKIDLIEKLGEQDVHNPYNYLLEIGIHIGKETKTFEILILFEQDKIKRATSRSQDGFYFYLPIISSRDSRDYNIEVIGLNPIIYYGYLVDYYYIPVSINGTPNTVQVQFLATGLVPGEYYQIYIRPYYWTENSPNQPPPVLPPFKRDKFKLLFV